ncbi:early nodulin-like protein 1 [Tanacetum coccineum]
MNVHVSKALEFVGGGKENSRCVPSALDEERFKTRDVLVFKFDPKKCITTKPIMKYKESPAKFKLVESGAFYFISGAEGSCDKGEKLAVKYLSHKRVVPPPAEAPKANAARCTAIGVAMS